MRILIVVPRSRSGKQSWGLRQFPGRHTSGNAVHADRPIRKARDLHKCCGFSYRRPPWATIITTTSGRSNRSAGITSGGTLHERKSVSHYPTIERRAMEARYRSALLKTHLSILPKEGRYEAHENLDSAYRYDRCVLLNSVLSDHSDTSRANGRRFQ